MEDLAEKYDKPSKLTSDQILEDLQDASLRQPPSKIIDSGKSPRESEWVNSNNFLVYHEKLIESLDKFSAAKDMLTRLDAELQKRMTEMKDQVNVK